MILALRSLMWLQCESKHPSHRIYYLEKLFSREEKWFVEYKISRSLTSSLWIYVVVTAVTILSLLRSISFHASPKGEGKVFDRKGENLVEVWILSDLCSYLCPLLSLLCPYLDPSPISLLPALLPLLLLPLLLLLLLLPLLSIILLQLLLLLLPLLIAGWSKKKGGSQSHGWTHLPFSTSARSYLDPSLISGPQGWCQHGTKGVKAESEQNDTVQWYKMHLAQGSRHTCSTPSKFIVIVQIILIHINTILIITLKNLHTSHVKTHKVEIMTGITDALLTDSLTDRLWKIELLSSL